MWNSSVIASRWTWTRERLRRELRAFVGHLRVRQRQAELFDRVRRRIAAERAIC